MTDIFGLVFTLLVCQEKMHSITNKLSLVYCADAEWLLGSIMRLVSVCQKAVDSNLCHSTCFCRVSTSHISRTDPDLLLIDFHSIALSKKGPLVTY